MLWLPGRSNSDKALAAQRPHWAALLAAYIDPIVSAVALLVSLKSFQVAERALQVNMASTQVLNQAQLVIEDGYLHFTSSTMPPRREDMQKVLSIGYTLENVDNSFAQIKSLTFSAEYPQALGGL